MPEVSVRNLKNEELRRLELAEEVFGYPPKRHLLYEAVHHQLAARRSGSEVSSVAAICPADDPQWRQSRLQARVISHEHRRGTGCNLRRISLMVFAVLAGWLLRVTAAMRIAVDIRHGR